MTRLLSLRAIPLILLLLFVPAPGLHAKGLAPQPSPRIPSAFTQLWNRLLDLVRPEGLVRAVGLLGHSVDPNGGGTGDLGHSIDPDGPTGDLGHTIDPDG